MKYIGLFDEKEDIVTKEKLEAVASRVSTNEDNIAMAESDIEGLQTTVGTLQTNVGNIQTALTSKQDAIVGAASTITEDNLATDMALVSNSSGKVAVSNVTSTELGYLDGVTSNVQTQLNKKLETVHDNDMLWGGKNLHGEVSPTDAAMVSVIGGNKFALCKSQGITVEYTNDGGATWVNYDATEETKINLISGISTVGLYYGKKTESSQIVTADDMLRITVNAWNCGVYTSLRKILIEFATSGSTNDFVKIESATIGDQETFTVVGTYHVSGNSGWNSIPYSNNFGAYSLNQVSNVGVLRFTFSTSTASSYQGRPYVQNLILNGITNYVNPSKLSATGHLYSYDYQQNATFPANVTANKFIGDGSNLTNVDYSKLTNKPTIPTKTSQLDNDSGFITSAPVTSVNTKTGAVTLSATDVSAIPSNLTGTAGQVLTKTSDGQEWKDATPRDVYFHVNGLLQNQDLQIVDAGTFSDLTNEWNQLVLSGSGDFKNVNIPMPCIDARYNSDSEGIIILRYAGIGPNEQRAYFTGIYYDASAELQYSISLLYQLGEPGFQQYNIIPVKDVAPSTTTPLAPTEAGSVGTSTAYARGDHVHPKQTVTKSDVGLGNVDNVSIDTRLNRTTNVNASDTKYTTYMARGEALFSAETTPSVNGCIAWQYG